MTPGTVSLILVGSVAVAIVANRILEYVRVGRRIKRVRDKAFTFRQQRMLADARFAHYSGDDRVATCYLDAIEKGKESIDA